jgi:hypothetical protein
MNLTKIINKWVESTKLGVTRDGKHISAQELASNAQLLESVFTSVEAKLSHLCESDFKVQHKNNAWVTQSEKLSDQFLIILMVIKELSQLENANGVIELR